MTTQIEHYYTLTDFENFLFSGTEYKLSQKVLDILSHLEKELAACEPTTDTTTPTYQTKKQYEKPQHDRRPMEKKQYKTDYKKEGRGSKNSKEISGEQWEAVRNFKATKIETKEGIDKRINDIRILLNKISAKNYLVQHAAFLLLVKEFFDDNQQSDESEQEENLKKLNKVIFDIICSNKVFSELYAELYKELIHHFPYFKEALDSAINNYITSISNIYYVDPNTNYDGFCSYTKLNDNRKTITLFLSNLLKNGVLDDNAILKNLDFLLNKSLEYIREHNRTNELEEITENIFLYVFNCEKVLSHTEMWKDTILTKITDISQMKTKDYPSLSNRIIFKYMDIVDSL